MKIVIRSKKHTFNVNVVSQLSEKDFKDHCLTLKIFTQLPEKERNSKIEETYGELHPNAKAVSKSRSGSDICDSDVKPIRRDTGTEPGTDVGRKDSGRKEDKAKVRKQELREKNSE